MESGPNEFSQEHLERCRRSGEAWGERGPGPAQQQRGFRRKWPWHLGAVDKVQARIDADTQRLMAGPGRNQLVWTPESGAFAALVHLVPNCEGLQFPRPQFYYQISRILLEYPAGGQNARWSDKFVIKHSAFVGVKVALAETDHAWHRYEPLLAPDGQPIPGSARFVPLPGTDQDPIISWNDFWGFSVSTPYANPRRDLVAMIG
jgi:hypothetical protein